MRGQGKGSCNVNGWSVDLAMLVVIRRNLYEACIREIITHRANVETNQRL